MGKGSRNRVRNSEAFRRNYDRIFSGSNLEPGRYTIEDGEAVRTTRRGARRRDAQNIESHAMGVSPDQVPEFNLKYNAHGVKFKPDGTAVFRDRQAKLKHLRMVGCHDNDEVRG